MPFGIPLSIPLFLMSSEVQEWSRYDLLVDLKINVSTTYNSNVELFVFC